VRRHSGVVSEAGTALVEVTWLAILLLLPMVWIVLSVSEVQKGSFGVTAAARSAGRAFALAPDDSTGRQRAEAAAAVALADQGLEQSDWSIKVTCPPRPDCHVGGAVVIVRVATSVPLPFVPELLGGAASFQLDAEHHVPIGQYQQPRGEGP
jgi:Flp pilus assembly protein TadG